MNSPLHVSAELEQRSGRRVSNLYGVGPEEEGSKSRAHELCVLMFFASLSEDGVVLL